MSENKKEINGYELSRSWFDWCFENPERITPSHTAIFFFAIEHCNRMGWKDKFGFPTQMVMDAIGIKKHETYIKYFNQIVEWGFIRLVQKSQNQYSANIISLKNALPISGKALDKAFLKHGGKQTRKQPVGMGESTGESKEGVDKQVNKEQSNQEPVTIEPVPPVAGSAGAGEQEKEKDVDGEKKAKVLSAELKSLHIRCKEFFMEKAAKDNRECNWNGRYGKDLKEILDKLKITFQNHNSRAPNDDETVNSFQYMMERLPTWYQDKSLALINTNYDEVITQIKQSKNGKSTSKAEHISDKNADQLKRVLNGNLGN